jgi:protein gp37
MLDVPLKRKKPTTYFVNSMSDLFHESLSDEDIDRVFAVMALCPQHTFQVLTKRAARMLRWATSSAKDAIECTMQYRQFGAYAGPALIQYPLPNVWLGISVEDQQRADERIPELLATPAAVRFLSVEPLLGPVDLTCVPWPHGWRHPDEISDGIDPLRFNRAKLDWVIVGGESGPGARPCDIAWVRSIVEQCAAAAVPCFVKQLGARPHVRLSEGDVWSADVIAEWPVGALFHQKMPGTETHWAQLRDRKGGDMSEWPADLRVRQMPEVPA